MCWYNTLHSLLQHFNKKWGYNLMFNSCNQIIRKYSVDARNSPASIKQLFFPILFLSSLHVKCSDRVQLLRKLNIPLHLGKKKNEKNRSNRPLPWQICKLGKCYPYMHTHTSSNFYTYTHGTLVDENPLMVVH